jgi:hypothetical protein
MGEAVRDPRRASIHASDPISRRSSSALAYATQRRNLARRSRAVTTRVSIATLACDSVDD